MKPRYQEREFFILQKQLRMSDIEDIALRFDRSKSYVEKIVQGRKFNFDILKAAVIRAKENITMYTNSINTMLANMENAENYTDEQMASDIEYAEKMLKENDV